jgi:type 1 glutamine amidotransferase
VRSLVAALTAATALALSAAPPAAAQAEPAGAGDPAFRVLVFSRTTGFRHASIPAGIQAIRQLGREHGFAVDDTEDPASFTSANLGRYAVVVFLNTTGNVLEPAHRTAFERYVSTGGGYMGIHSAADTEYEWPFYARVVGAYFNNHPLQQTASFVREDARHPATRHLAPRFTVFDEFYSFRRNPRQDTHVLLRIDESSYSPDPNTSNLPGGTPATGVMGDHPMSWCHRVDRGRSFYTALGHEPYLYAQDWYLRHLLGGLRTAAGRLPADCSTPAGGRGGSTSGTPVTAPAPALRLTRRCIGAGRLRMRVTGGAGAIRQVAFKFGKRLVRRDGAAPFDRVPSRRTLRRTRATQLRAIAYPRDGSARPIVLARTLPRCGLGRRRPAR